MLFGHLLLGNYSTAPGTTYIVNRPTKCNTLPKMQKKEKRLAGDWG